MVPEVGVEPTRSIKPTDFSAVGRSAGAESPTLQILVQGGTVFLDGARGGSRTHTVY